MWECPHRVTVRGSVICPGRSIVHSYWTVSEFGHNCDVFTLQCAIGEEKFVCFLAPGGQSAGTQWQSSSKAVGFIFLSYKDPSSQSFNFGSETWVYLRISEEKKKNGEVPRMSRCIYLGSYFVGIGKVPKLLLTMLIFPKLIHNFQEAIVGTVLELKNYEVLSN